jgi:hypothetical protein
MHDQFLAERDANAGKIPVIEAGTPETIKMQSPQGELRFKAPVLNIVSWIDRPAQMDGSAPAPQEHALEPSAPPVAAPPPAADSAGSDLF